MLFTEDDKNKLIGKTIADVTYNDSENYNPSITLTMSDGKKVDFVIIGDTGHLPAEITVDFPKQ